MSIRVNPVGVAEFMHSPAMKEQLAHVAGKVADNVRAQRIRVGGDPEGIDRIDLPVESGVYDSHERVEGVVTLAHPSGEAVQAKYGALTKAAAQAGLLVRSAE